MSQFCQSFVLGAVGTLSSPAEGQSVLKLIWPEVLHNYPFVVLKLLASWHYSHAFWLHSLITWKNGRGKQRSGEPPSSCDTRRKVFVSPQSLQVRMEKCCVSNSTEASALISSSASLKCHDGTDQSVYVFMQYPQLSPVHKWLWVLPLVFLCFSSELWNGDNVFCIPSLSVFYMLSYTVCGIKCSLPQEQELVAGTDTVSALVVHTVVWYSFRKTLTRKKYGTAKVYMPYFIKC